jgi:hypothetical protein
MDSDQEPVRAQVPAPVAADMEGTTSAATRPDTFVIDY